MILQVKVPAIIASSVVCLALGAGAAVFVMVGLGIGPRQWVVTDPSQLTTNPSNAMMAKGGGGGKGGGFKAPSAKVRLGFLVDKLQILTGQPLNLNLDAEQKKKIQEQLKDLEAQDELADDEAKKRLDNLLLVLKDAKEPLEAVGYRWPAQKEGGGFTPPPETPNPFKEEAKGKRLQALRQQLGK